MKTQVTETQATRTFASDLAEMMTTWNEIRAAALRSFPGATDDEIQQIASGAMEHSMGMTPGRTVR